MIAWLLLPLQFLLQNGTLGDAVSETEGLIKRHEAFEKLLSSQEDKVCSSAGPPRFPSTYSIIHLTSPFVSPAVLSGGDGRAAEGASER